MCSIGGWIAKEPLDIWLAERLTKGLIFYGRPRGKQASGIWIRHAAGATVHKAAVDPKEFIKDEAWSAAWKLEGVDAVLTHTRQPTCGGTGDEQAQPFVGGENGSVVTIHNGWYRNVKELKTAFDITKPSGVDSELVTSYIAAKGVTSLHEFLDRTSGSSAIGAVVNGQMYVVRDSGPIEYLSLELDDGNLITVFASTEQQALLAMRYCWTLMQDTRTVTIPYMTLCEICPDGVTEIESWRSTFHHTPRPAGRAKDSTKWSDIPGWKLNPETGGWTYTPPDKTSAETEDNDATEELPPAEFIRPPDLPADVQEQLKDYHDLAVKGAFSALSDDEAARLAYYLAMEDTDVPPRS